MARRSLVSTAVFLLFTACASSPPDGATGPAWVPQQSSARDAESFAATGDVRIVAHPGASFETTVAVSPQNASQAVIGVMSVAHGGVDIYATHDAGLTWSSGTPLPVEATNGRTYDAGQGDPVVVADRLGIFHFAALMTSGTSPAKFTSVAASRSVDGGLSWSAPIIVAELPVLSGAAREFDDKEWLAVDDTGGRFDGHLYLLWQRISFATTPFQSRMMFSRSTDRGLTWSAPVALTAPSTSGQSMVTIGPAGEVYLSYFRSADGGHVLRTSTDGGETFGDPLRVPMLPWIGGVIPNTSKATFKAFPTLLCDRSSGPNRGTLYVVIGTDTTTISGQRAGGAAVARSTDGGRTWSTPRMISTPTNGDAIFPSGAIDQTTGDLVVTWLDRRDDPANTLARLYATRSRDGGLTFDPPRGFSPQFSIDADWIGDYYGVAGHGGKWIATFSPASGEMSAVALRFEEPVTGPRRRSIRTNTEPGRRRAVRHPPNEPAKETPWLRTAVETAAWLEAVARVRGEGLAWSNDTAAPDAVTPGLPGTSGAGFFFLRLFQVTREPHYLTIAERAATYVASTCGSLGFDWQAGTVGCGEFLAAMYRETRDPRQLERAEAMATSLLNRAKRDGGGMFWDFPGSSNVYTGIAHGAGGVIVLMLDLYELTGHQKYLDAAEAAWAWISRHNVVLGEGAVGWKRLTTDTTAYNGWCGGAAGMIFVFDRLFALTGKSEYREQLTATAEGLLTTAVPAPEGYRWTYDSRRTGGSPLVYCHGSACSIGSLARAYEVAGDPRFLAMATAGATHLETSGHALADGTAWPHIESSSLVENGFMVGGASVGHGFLRLYRTTRDPRYLQVAEAAGRALVATADHPSPGMSRWGVLVEPVPPQYASEQAMKVAWWDGTAGIGMFLLELHQFSIGVDPPSHFSPANP